MDLELPNFIKAQDQEHLLLDALVLAFDDVEKVVEQMSDVRVFQTHRAVHMAKVRGNKVLKMRSLDNEVGRYRRVQALISEMDFPMITVCRNVFPYLLYYHGFPIYTKMELGHPFTALMDGKLTKEHIKNEGRYDYMWDSILAERLFEDNPEALSELREFWRTFEKDLLHSLMIRLEERLEHLQKLQNFEWLYKKT